MRFLVDNSVLQRLGRSSEIRAEVSRLVDRGAVLCASTVSVLEAGFSARSHAAHQQIVLRLTESFELLALTERVGAVAVELQDALWRAGMGRAAGVVDLLHVATAVAYEATVLHYDADFDHIAGVDPRLHAQWVVAQGSVS